MRKSFLISLLALTSCIRQTSREVNGKYLSCYALDPDTKKECLQNFQYESEKLGFKQFINDHKLACDKIEEGPIFSEEKKAYIVTCKPKGQYFMRFDYETGKWRLIEEKK